MHACREWINFWAFLRENCVLLTCILFEYIFSKDLINLLKTARKFCCELLRGFQEWIYAQCANHLKISIFRLAWKVFVLFLLQFLFLQQIFLCFQTQLLQFQKKENFFWGKNKFSKIHFLWLAKSALKN